MKRPLLWNYKSWSLLRGGRGRLLEVVNDGLILLWLEKDTDHTSISGEPAVEICIPTIRFWQHNGWLGPLPKRVPKSFRDALKGIK